MTSHADRAMTTEQWQGTLLGWFACFVGMALAPFLAIFGPFFDMQAVGYVLSAGLTVVALAGALAVWRNVGRRAGRPATAPAAILAAFTLGGLLTFAVYWDLAVVSPI